MRSLCLNVYPASVDPDEWKEEKNRWVLRESTDAQRAVTPGSPAARNRNSVTNVIKNSRTSDLPIIPSVSGFDPGIRRGFQITWGGRVGRTSPTRGSYCIVLSVCGKSAAQKPERIYHFAVQYSD